jgi:endoribonuclease Dicer
MCRRRTWYPDGMTLIKGKGNEKDKIRMQTHRLGDKSIADVSEALIGAALLSRPHGDFDNAVKAVTTLVRNPDHDISKWSDYYELYNKPTHQTDKPSASHIDLAAKVETKHDYHFTYPRLLRAAFYHPSMPWQLERIPSYQRLEFLGDALFDMACVNFLFSRFPDRDPQWLTEHKVCRVNFTSLYSRR